MSIYYDYDKILSYNCYLNFLIGERGVGKTFGITKHVINRFLKNGERFVYVRRYKTELTKSAPKFFEKVEKLDEFKNIDFKYSKGNFFINNKLAGYSVILSTAQQLKGSNYLNVKWIIFDEFIIEKSFSRYLPNEVNTFLGLIETVARMEDVRCFLLGNSVSLNNPYFNYFNMDLPYNSDIKLFKNNLILFQYMKNEEYRKEKMKTRFGQLVANTQYQKYAIENTFSTNNNFIKKKNSNCKFSFILLYNNEYYGVWSDFIHHEFFISNDYYKDGFIYSCTLNDHSPSTIFIKMAKKSFSFKLLLEAFQLGLVFFENQKIKEKTIDIFKILL